MYKDIYILLVSRVYVATNVAHRVAGGGHSDLGGNVAEPHDPAQLSDCQGSSRVLLSFLRNGETVLRVRGRQTCK